MITRIGEYKDGDMIMINIKIMQQADLQFIILIHSTGYPPVFCWLDQDTWSMWAVPYLERLGFDLTLAWQSLDICSIFYKSPHFDIFLSSLYSWQLIPTLLFSFMTVSYLGSFHAQEYFATFFHFIDLGWYYYTTEEINKDDQKGVSFLHLISNYLSTYTWIYLKSGLLLINWMDSSFFPFLFFLPSFFPVFN